MPVQRTRVPVPAASGHTLARAASVPVLGLPGSLAASTPHEAPGPRPVVNLFPDPAAVHFSDSCADPFNPRCSCPGCLSCNADDWFVVTGSGRR